MRIKFLDDQLAKLDTQPTFTGGHRPELVTAIRQRLRLLRAAPTERALLPLRALAMQRRAANRDSYLMRVDDEFCLTLDFDGSDAERRALVNELTQYSGNL